VLPADAGSLRLARNSVDALAPARGHVLFARRGATMGRSVRRPSR
jgi:hypothetical protein